jgi:hypothetical protein
MNEWPHALATSGISVTISHHKKTEKQQEVVIMKRQAWAKFEWWKLSTKIFSTDVHFL